MRLGINDVVSGKAGHCPTRRRRNRHFRLGGVSNSFASRYRPLDLRFASGIWPCPASKWSSPRHVLFYGFRDAACCRRRHSHARSRRRLRHQAHRAPSLAYVLWAVHRHRVLLPGTAIGIPRFHTQNKRTFCAGYPATPITDFLAIPSSLHKCLQGKVDITRRRCLLLTDLAFELTSQQDTGGRQ